MTAEPTHVALDSQAAERSTEMPDADLRPQVRAVLAQLLESALTESEDGLALADLHPDRYDSLGVLDCVAAVEDAFAISIDLVDDDLRATFRSVADIAALVRRKRADLRVLDWDR